MVVLLEKNLQWDFWNYTMCMKINILRINLKQATQYLGLDTDIKD